MTAFNRKRDLLGTGEIHIKEYSNMCKVFYIEHCNVCTEDVDDWKHRKQRR